MAKRGRPRLPSGSGKGEAIQLRVSALEKGAFKDAAELAGIGLSTWIRERLRRAAVRELEEVGRIAQFLDQGGR